MQLILHSVHISSAETLASKLVTLKAKNLLTQVLEGGYEKKCTIFCHYTEELYASCLEYQTCGSSRKTNCLHLAACA
jgi:hypothetical protein